MPSATAATVPVDQPEMPPIREILAERDPNPLALPANFLKGFGQFGLGMSDLIGLGLRGATTLARTKLGSPESKAQATAEGIRMVQEATRALTEQATKPLIEGAKLAKKFGEEPIEAGIETAGGLAKLPITHPFEVLPIAGVGGKVAATAARGPIRALEQISLGTDLNRAARTGGKVTSGASKVTTAPSATSQRITAVRVGTEEVAEKGPFVAAFQGAVRKGRQMSPEIDEMFRAREHYVETGKLIDETNELEFFRPRNEATARLNKSFSGMTKPEREDFTDYISQIRQIPNDASPAALEAYEAWKDLGGQGQQLLIDLGKLTAQEAKVRAFQPLRIHRFAQQLEAGEPRAMIWLKRNRDRIIQKELKEQYGRDWKRQWEGFLKIEQDSPGEMIDFAKNLVQRGKASPEIDLQRLRKQPGKVGERATRRLDLETKALEQELVSQGRDMPMYFPALRKIRSFSDFLPSRGGQRPRPTSLRHSTGATLASGDFKRDLRIIGAKMVSDQRKVASFETLLQKVMVRLRKSGEIKIWNHKDELASNEALFSPDGLRILVRRHTDMTERFMSALGEVGDVDMAIAKSIRDMLEKNPIIMDSSLLGKARVYIVPKAVMNRFNDEFVGIGLLPESARNFFRLTFDRPLDWWRTWVLAMRPAWLMNNVAGNAIFATLQGVRPQSFVRAMQEKYRAKATEKAPRLIGGGLTSSELQRVNLGSATTTTGGQLVEWVENWAPSRMIGKFADATRHVNTATDDYYRVASFLEASGKFARKNFVKRTGQQFNESMHLLEELDRLTPAQLDQVVTTSLNFMGNYRFLHPWERHFIRRAVPFYAFLKHQAKLQALLPIQYPGRAVLAQRFFDLAHDASEDSERFLPEFVRGKGMVDLGIDIKVAGTNYRAYLNTQGLNPLLMGFSTAGEQVFNSSSMTEALISVTNPIGFLGVSPARVTQLISGKDPFGRAFTEEMTVENRGKFFRFTDETNPVDIKRDFGGNISQVAPPVPGHLENLTTAIPLARTGRRMLSPRARATAEPLSLSPTREKEGTLFATTRVIEMLRYLTSASITLINKDEPTRAFPMSKSQRRAIIRNLNRKRVIKEGRK